MDLRNLLITVLAVPLVVIALKRVRSFLGKVIKYAVDAVTWHIGRVLFHRMSTRVSLRHYARTQLELEDTKYLLVPGREPLSLLTDDIYVPLTLELGSGQRSTFSHTDILSAGRRVRIVGDPGSGKSSMVKRIYRDACARALWASEPMLPVRVELKHFTPPEDLAPHVDLADWAIEHLRHMICEVKGFEMGQLFDSYIDTAGLLVLLDGLDEVPTDSLARTLDTIRALSRRLANASTSTAIILTMRTQFHKEVRGELETDFPNATYVQPFTPADIYTFLQLWPFEENAASTASRIYGELTDRPTVREMCSNPLVLAMYVAHDQSERVTTSAADTRTEFYSQVVEELLVARRSRQMAAPARKSLREAREHILGTLALENLTDGAQPANSLSWRRARELVSETYDVNSVDEADRRFRELAKETGILSEEREGETFRFIHLTFCEFLAAAEAVHGRTRGWATIVSAHHAFRQNGRSGAAARLSEVLPFTCALLPRVDRPEAIAEVAKLGDSAVLARCFLETQAYDHEEWPTFIETEAASITDTPPDEWDELWLRRLHLLNVLLRDSATWARNLGTRAPVLFLDAVFTRLVGSSRDRLIRVFSSYANQDAAAAFRLADAVGVNLVVDEPNLVVANLGQPPFLGIALETAGRQPGSVDEWALVLAEGAAQQSLVAGELNARRSPAAFRAAAREVPKDRSWSPLDYASRWRNSLMIKGRVGAGSRQPQSTFLTDSLTIGVKALRSRPAPCARDKFPELCQMVDLTAPNSLIRTRVLQLIALVVAVGTGVGAYLAVDVDAGFGLADLSLPGVILLAGLLCAYTIGASYPEFRSTVYLVASGIFPAVFAQATLWSERLAPGRWLGRVLHRDVYRFATRSAGDVDRLVDSLQVTRRTGPC
jgi:hypothetical protein